MSFSLFSILRASSEGCWWPRGPHTSLSVRSRREQNLPPRYHRGRSLWLANLSPVSTRKCEMVGWPWIRLYSWGWRWTKLANVEEVGFWTKPYSRWGRRVCCMDAGQANKNGPFLSGVQRKLMLLDSRWDLRKFCRLRREVDTGRQKLLVCSPIF